MSKMDALRALREARYEEEAARGRPSGEAPTRTRTQRMAASRPARATEAEPSAGTPAPEAGLCGHKSMNGRTCTRESGHTAKSHRYS
jgi:hypothetical protein